MAKHLAQVCSGTIAAIALGLSATSASAQIVPTPTGDLGTTGTIVTPIGTTLDITGGVENNTALFHSFSQFDVSQGQTANFQTAPNIQNVLTRVLNGNPSVIDGTLKITGSQANLFVMNPAGIIFGPNINLNLPGAFVGTTANSINQYQSVDGTSAFVDVWANKSFEDAAFQTQFSDANRGAIVSFGNLSSYIDVNVNPNIYRSSLSLISRGVAIPGDTNITNKISISIPDEDISSNRNSTENLVSLGMPGMPAIPTLKDGEIRVGNITTPSLFQGFSQVSINGRQVQTGNITSGYSIGVGASSSLVTGNLESLGFVSVYAPESIQVGNINARSATINGDQIRIGDINADVISFNDITTTKYNGDGVSAGVTSVASNSSITTGHLNSKGNGDNFNVQFVFDPPTGEPVLDGASVSPAFKREYRSYITLNGANIKVASLFAQETIGTPSTGFIAIQAKDSFQVTGTIPETADLAQFRSRSTDPNIAAAPISIAGKTISINAPNAFRTFAYADVNNIAANLPRSSNLATTTGITSTKGISVAQDQFRQAITLPIALPANPEPILTPIAPNSPPITSQPNNPNVEDAIDKLDTLIDPTDTIDLSAGAIRGAAINPGGLLKVELDTTNPEGVLTRKVTTK
jgi:filamentous hemagglutinin family protein